MNKFVITFNAIEGFHNYPDAPKFCEYLASRHRHMFHIRCEFEVLDSNREIEFNSMQNEISQYLHHIYGEPCEFRGMSCEMIAEKLLTAFDAAKVEVLEDGYGGAKITR